MYTSLFRYFFFFNDTATTEIYTLSLHDALPIYAIIGKIISIDGYFIFISVCGDAEHDLDRKSTRLNSSHLVISYAVFCLKKKKLTITIFNLKKKKNIIM